MRKSFIAMVALTIAPSLALTSTIFAQGAPATAQQASAKSSALDDPTIVAIFDEANTADIETGTLAMQKGHSKEVRDFGAMLARDHKQVRQLGRDLASKLGVTPTPPVPDAGLSAHQATMESLRKLSGEAFDHAFLQHEVAFHKAVIDAVNSTLLPAIQNAEVKALVVKVAPAFQAHMLAAAALDNKLQGKKGAN